MRPLTSTSQAPRAPSRTTCLSRGWPSETISTILRSWPRPRSTCRRPDRGLSASAVMTVSVCASPATGPRSPPSSRPDADSATRWPSSTSLWPAPMRSHSPTSKTRAVRRSNFLPRRAATARSTRPRSGWWAIPPAVCCMPAPSAPSPTPTSPMRCWASTPASTPSGGLSSTPCPRRTTRCYSPCASRTASAPR